MGRDSGTLSWSDKRPSLGRAGETPPAYPGQHMVRKLEDGEVAAWMGHENFIANLRVTSRVTAVGRANVGRAGTWGLLLLF